MDVFDDIKTGLEQAIEYEKGNLEANASTRFAPPSDEGKKFEFMRATEEWQRAGAYAVRVQGMNRAFHIPLREEFDEKDAFGTKYIVVLDDGYPMGTCRFYPVFGGAVSLGRVVILPEYRGQNLGRRMLEEAERWIKELGYTQILVNSRIPAVGFYQKLGYVKTGAPAEPNGVFECVPMSKTLL